MYIPFHKTESCCVASSVLGGERREGGDDKGAEWWLLLLLEIYESIKKQTIKDSHVHKHSATNQT